MVSAPQLVSIIFSLAAAALHVDVFYIKPNTEMHGHTIAIAKTASTFAVVGAGSMFVAECLGPSGEDSASFWFSTLDLLTLLVLAPERASAYRWRFSYDECHMPASWVFGGGGIMVSLLEINNSLFPTAVAGIVTAPQALRGMLMGNDTSNEFLLAVASRPWIASAVILTILILATVLACIVTIRAWRFYAKRHRMWVAAGHAVESSSEYSEQLRRWSSFAKLFGFQVIFMAAILSITIATDRESDPSVRIELAPLSSIYLSLSLLSFPISLRYFYPVAAESRLGQAMMRACKMVCTVAKKTNAEKPADDSAEDQARPRSASDQTHEGQRPEEHAVESVS